MFVHKKCRKNFEKLKLILGILKCRAKCEKANLYGKLNLVELKCQTHTYDIAKKLRLDLLLLLKTFVQNWKALYGLE